jgi:hypothetical protein
MKKLLIGLAFAVLALPAGAVAGGWATAGVSPPPDDMGPGQTWDARIELKQHGVTPLDNVEPIVMISNGPTDRSFPAKPTGEPGIYVAKVVFPSKGEWSYRVDDGFSQTHSFAPVTIGGVGAAAGDGDGFPTLTVTAVIALLLGLTGVLYLLARRIRVRAPAPTH